MAEEIKVPQIAEGADSATVTEILVSEGDRIEKEQSLIVVESDKASVEIPSPESGTVKSIKVSEGDEVKVGDVILSLETSDSGNSSEDKSKDDKGEVSDQSKNEEKDDDDTETSEETEGNGEDKSAKKKKTEDDDEDNEEDEGSETESSDSDKDKGDGGDDEIQETDESDDDGAEKEKKGDGEEDLEENEKEKSETPKKDKKDQDDEESSDAGAMEDNDPTQKSEIGVAPGVRRLARELGVDLDSVEGSGNAGHISMEDVKTHAKKRNSEKGNQGSQALPDFNQWGDIERKSLSGIRSATAKNVSLAWKTIPHVFQFDEAEISGIEKYIDKNSEKAEEAGGKLTITAVLVKIIAVALRQFPKFNASIDMAKEQMILKNYVNIGIAVDTEKGLLVPVLKNADKKSIIDISVEITELAQKARDGKLNPDEMQGGNFTISNLGGIGGTQFTPIILPPQVAILGVSRANKKPVYLDGKFGARNILPLSLSYDHRLIDGAEGVRFIDWIARAIEDPYSALLEA